MATHSSTLAWKITWTEEPGGLQSMGSLPVWHDWAASLSLFTFMHWRRKWQPTPVFLPGKSHGQRSLEDYSPCSCKRVGRDLIINVHKRQLYTWTSPDGQHQNQIDYILCSWRWRSSIQSANTRPGTDCGSDHQLLIDKFRLKLKKVGKTTRPFRYDLNQILYNYTVEVTNRFKGLDLIDRVPEELWMEVHNTV